MESRERVNGWKERGSGFSFVYIACDTKLKQKLLSLWSKENKWVRDWNERIRDDSRQHLGEKLWVWGWK